MITEKQWEEQQEGIKALKKENRDLLEQLEYFIKELDDMQAEYAELENTFGVYKMNHPDDDRDKGSDG